MVSSIIQPKCASATHEAQLQLRANLVRLRIVQFLTCFAVALAGELSATTVTIEMQSGPVSHAFDPAFTVTLSTGSQVTFPASASDSVDFLSTFSEFELGGATRLEFLLSAPPNATFVANPGAGAWLLSFSLVFVSSNPDLVLSSLRASFLGSAGDLPIRLFNRTGVAGPATEFEIYGGSFDPVISPVQFGGILVTADIDSPANDGVLTLVSSSAGMSSRDLRGNTDPPPALAIVPEPSLPSILLGTWSLFLLKRKRAECISARYASRTGSCRSPGRLQRPGSCAYQPDNLSHPALARADFCGNLGARGHKPGVESLPPVGCEVAPSFARRAAVQ